MTKYIILALALMGFTTPVAAADAITACDKLAGHPEDPDKVGPGVSKPDLAKAIEVCTADLKTDPENRRLRYQLARVLFYSQRTEEAMPHLEFAANAGSQQAQFVLGYIIDEALQGVKRDVCKVEDMWYKSANQGRHAALVSYVHHVVNDQFKGCKVQASSAEIEAYLAKAQKDASGFYQTLLARTLTADYARFKQGQ
jgi:hypothetical protein